MVANTDQMGYSTFYEAVDPNFFPIQPLKLKDNFVEIHLTLHMSISHQQFHQRLIFAHRIV